jgi:hypothetical protein
MVLFANAKHRPGESLQRLFDVTPLKLALSGKRTIHEFMRWPLFIFRHLRSFFALIFDLSGSALFPCFWAGILFDKLWSVCRLFERPGNVYNCEAKAIIVIQSIVQPCLLLCILNPQIY